MVLMPVSISVMYFICQILFGNINGGHFNPAITLAVFLHHKVPNKKQKLAFLVNILLSQLSGAIIGVLIVAMTNVKNERL